MNIKHFTIGIAMAALAILLLPSCSPDCKNVSIQKVEWTTEYIAYSVDTLVKYTITKNETRLTEWLSDNNRDNHSHSVTIRNDNHTYSNKFAVQFHCYDNGRRWTQTTDYVVIPANSEHTFSYKWLGTRGTYYSEFDVNVSVLQLSKRIRLQRRVDELVLKDTTVNNCECDVDALNAEYKAIQDVFEKLKNENFIKTE
ncbi:MAG: hypothetical protein LBS50_09150 [Prevotellaceae bacterium]|jgi:hypothetical protein|nr:hypothetical protein [Prevotellaceae bacterium]